jgi:hypothetical protein
MGAIPAAARDRSNADRSGHASVWRVWRRTWYISSIHVLTDGVWWIWYVYILASFVNHSHSTNTRRRRRCDAYQCCV